MFVCHPNRYARRHSYILTILSEKFVKLTLGFTNMNWLTYCLLCYCNRNTDYDPVCKIDKSSLTVLQLILSHTNHRHWNHCPWYQPAQIVQVPCTMPIEYCTLCTTVHLKLMYVCAACTSLSSIVYVQLSIWSIHVCVCTMEYCIYTYNCPSFVVVVVVVVVVNNDV